LSASIILKEIWNLKLQLNPIAQAVVDVKQWSLYFTFYELNVCVQAMLISQFLLPGMPGSSVRIGGPP
jgi:hypothetical protein